MSLTLHPSQEKELVKLANMLGLKNKSYVQELIAGAAFTESNFSVAKTACDQAITAGRLYCLCSSSIQEAPPELLAARSSFLDPTIYNISL